MRFLPVIHCTRGRVARLLISALIAASPCDTSMAKGLGSDGIASLEIVLASESTVVCAKIVDGAAQAELFGLHACNGALKWRAQTTSVRSKGMPESSNAFYLLTKDFLEKRHTELIFAPTAKVTLPEAR